MDKPVNDELGFSDIIEPLIKGWRTLALAILIGSISGVVIYFMSGKYYLATSNFIPTVTASSSLGDLAGVAKIAGLKVPEQEGGLSPILFPKLVNNVEVRLKLAELPLILSTGDTSTFRDYIVNVYEPSVLGKVAKLPKKLKSLIVPSRESESIDLSFIKLSDEDFMVISELEERINILTEQEDGAVTIAVEMPEAILAAQMAKHVEAMLQQAIVDYKTTEISNEYEYIVSTLEKKKKEFEEAQEELSLFADRNLIITSNTAKIEFERLESNLRIKERIYDQILNEKELTELDLNKSIPQFVVIKPVIIPYEKASPSGMLYLIFFGTFGLLVGSIIVMAPFFKKFVGYSKSTE
ncbi:hypothetical protein [Ekhidna sp.]